MGSGGVLIRLLKSILSHSTADSKSGQVCLDSNCLSIPFPLPQGEKTKYSLGLIMDTVQL